MNLKDKLWCYIYHKLNELEKEKEEIRYSLRNRPMDSLDMYEYMRNEIKIECFNEFVRNLTDIIINHRGKP